MVLEWIRRHDRRFSHEMKDYLFTTKSLKTDSHDH